MPGEKSWFAVAGSISKDKIGIAETGKVEIINLKDDPEEVQQRIDGERFFKAYHMNKQHWYTVCMDDRVSDEQLEELIGISFRLVERHFYSRKPV